MPKTIKQKFTVTPSVQLARAANEIAVKNAFSETEAVALLAEAACSAILDEDGRVDLPLLDRLREAPHARTVLARLDEIAVEIRRRLGALEERQQEGAALLRPLAAAVEAMRLSTARPTDPRQTAAARPSQGGQAPAQRHAQGHFSSPPVKASGAPGGKAGASRGAEANRERQVALPTTSMQLSRGWSRMIGRLASHLAR